MEAELLSHQLVATARQRLSTEPAITEADLRRATSDLYYALFHCISEALVEPIVQNTDDPAFKETYKTLYRLPDHSFVERKCKEISRHDFDVSIKHFAQQVVVFKNKRTNADYDPLAKFRRSTVLSDTEIVETAIKMFARAPSVERARFAYFVSIKPRS